MIDAELVQHLVNAAEERGVTVGEMLGDWHAALAVANFREIEGRVVLHRGGGVPELADKVNELVAGAVYPRARIRRVLLVRAGLNAGNSECGAGLAEVVAHIGAKKRARVVVDGWSRVVADLRAAGN